MAQFTNKSVLVTGGASGIGRIAALRFAQEGARVCVADLNLSGAEAVADRIRADGGDAVAIKADVAQPDDNIAMIDAVIDRFGGLDIAFLNAGYLGPMQGFEATDLEFFDRLIGINLRGCFLGLKAVHGAIRDGGAVVVTASTAGLVGFAEAPAYAASKHGVIGLVKSAAPAFAARGARINAICPGGVETPMMGGADIDPIDPSMLPRVPLRGMGSAQHVAEMALWLASPAAGFVTGQAHLCESGLLSTFVDSPTGP